MRILAEDFLYDIYRRVASAAGFDHYPKIRWSEETVSLDSLATKRTNISNLINNKHISWDTGVDTLGFDAGAELSRLEKQLEPESKGILMSGSSFQQSGGGNSSDGDGTSGRPSGHETTQNGPGSDQRNNRRTPQSTAPSQNDRGSILIPKETAEKIDKIFEILSSLTPESE
jgi:hypothetical protein